MGVYRCCAGVGVVQGGCWMKVECCVEMGVV